MEDCLDLSVAHFFGMLRESNIIMSRNYAHLADIAYIPNCGYPYYEQLKARYARVLSDGLADEPPNGPAPLQTRKVFKSESVEAKYAVMELFKGMGLH
jgi:hypothetical protein